MKIFFNTYLQDVRIAQILKSFTNTQILHIKTSFILHVLISNEVLWGIKYDVMLLDSNNIDVFSLNL